MVCPGDLVKHINSFSDLLIIVISVADNGVGYLHHRGFFHDNVDVPMSQLWRTRMVKA